MVTPSSLEQLSFSKGSEITYIEKKKMKISRVKNRKQIFSLASYIYIEVFYLEFDIFIFLIFSHPKYAACFPQLFGVFL